MKLLSPKVLTYKGIIGPSIIEFSDDRLVVSPFEVETALTEYVPYPLAVLKSSSIDEFLLDDIEHTMRSNPINVAIKKLDELFRSSRLYYEDSDDCNPAIVRLKK